MTARRIQRQVAKYVPVSDANALAQWMKAEQAAERAERRKAQMYMAAMVAIYLSSACLTVAVALLAVDIVRSW